MKEIFSFLIKVNQKSVKDLLAKSNRFKIISIVVILALCSLFSVIFRMFSTEGIVNMDLVDSIILVVTFIYYLFYYLFLNLILVFIFCLILKVLYKKTKFLDLFFMVMVSSIIIIIVYIIAIIFGLNDLGQSGLGIFAGSISSGIFYVIGIFASEISSAPGIFAEFILLGGIIWYMVVLFNGMSIMKEVGVLETILIAISSLSIFFLCLIIIGFLMIFLAVYYLGLRV